LGCYTVVMLQGDALKIGISEATRIKWVPAEMAMSAREAAAWAATGFLKPAGRGR